MFFSLEVSGNPVRLRPLVQWEVYRVGAEAIRNACEHSNSDRLEITLSYDDEFILRITDYGVGFDARKYFGIQNGHFGIRMMQERAARMGGVLRFDTALPSGTTAQLVLPREVSYEK